MIIVSGDSPRLMMLARESHAARVEPYWLGGTGWYGYAEGDAWYGIVQEHDPAGRHTWRVGGHHTTVDFRLTMPGIHMARNAAAAIAAGHALGVDGETMAAALASFRGAHRRFELVGEARGITIIDDFAHHPTEVRVNLTAARERHPGRRLVLIFQPHTYSRTAYLLKDFIDCFAEADKLFVLETFASRETPEAGLSAQELAGAVIAPPCEYVPSSEDAADRLLAELRSGDILVTMGAGDVDRVGRAVLEGLRSA
jgi:UDP-N-acetylmuramate--alanine ligase